MSPSISKSLQLRHQRRDAIQKTNEVGQYNFENYYAQQKNHVLVKDVGNKNMIKVSV